MGSEDMTTTLPRLFPVLALITSACAASAPGATPPGEASDGPGIEAAWEQDGSDVVVTMEVSGFELRFERGDVSGRTGHLHVFVDRAPVSAGAPIGFEEGIIHTVRSQERLPDLDPGEHTVYVVVADGADRAFSPLVMTKLDITVTEDGDS